MGWSVEFNKEYHIIQTIYWGFVSSEELKRVFEKGKALSTEHDTTLVLTDCRKLKGGHTLTDLYSLISLYEAHHVHKMKEAVLIPSLELIRDYGNFYETACQNRGFKVKLFSDVQEAIAWLIS